LVRQQTQPINNDIQPLSSQSTANQPSVLTQNHLRERQNIAQPLLMCITLWAKMNHFQAQR
ncbi:MAG: hypothetical protein ACRCVV_19715, partial [Shewanella sp.]